MKKITITCCILLFALLGSINSSRAQACTYNYTQSCGSSGWTLNPTFCYNGTVTVCTPYIPIVCVDVPQYVFKELVVAWSAGFTSGCMAGSSSGGSGCGHGPGTCYQTQIAEQCDGSTVTSSVGGATSADWATGTCSGGGY